MEEKDKCIESQNGSGSEQRYPGKDQIIARLVQIRECTGKAEETLHNMPPNSQNDPKFYQLQEMIAEMRDTEKRLLDILGDYEAGSPFRNRFCVDNSQVLQSSACASSISEEVEDVSLHEAQNLGSLAQDLLSEREVLKQRCVESQQRIEMLEKQRKVLMDACSRSSERGKSVPVTHFGETNDLNSKIDMRMQVVREGESAIFSQRCGSAGGVVTSEIRNDQETHGPNLSELADKRLEIHSIISEIALLRRAKDESARKIELLQQALKRSEDAEADALRMDSAPVTAPSPPAPPPPVPVKMESMEFLDDFGMDRDNNSDHSNLTGPADWMSDSFSETITRKLVEIQAMRQKLETLQNLVHTIPTPGSYQSVENEVDVLTLKGSDSLKDTPVNVSSRLNGNSYNMGVENMDFDPHTKTGSCTSTRSSYATDMDQRKSTTRIRPVKNSLSRGMDQADDFGRNSERSLGCSNRQGMESPPPRQVRPVPIRAQPSGSYTESLVFPGLPRSDRDVHVMSKNMDSNERLPGSFMSQSSGDFMSPDARIMGPVFESERQWSDYGSPMVAAGYNTHHRHTSHSSHCSSHPADGMTSGSSSSVLKHLVRTMDVIVTGLDNQNKQIDSLKQSMDRLTSRFDLLMGTEVEGSRIPSGGGRRNNAMSDSLPDMLPNIGGHHGLDSRSSASCERSSNGFYSGSRLQNIFQDMNFDYSQMKGANPTREMWTSTVNSASCSTSVPPEHLNVGLGEDTVGVGTSSAFYNPNPTSKSKVQRPWVSPGSLEPSRLMLNNQVPPGNRTNNYWDNFRSQSRQNVLSSSTKSNESFNAVVTAINPEAAAHAQAAGVSSTNNFNRLEARHDKNPGAKPIKAVMMKHFVENIGSKKRNQEQQRQLMPQRSVSVGSMPHTIENSNLPSTSGLGMMHGGSNEVNLTAVRGNKVLMNTPGDYGTSSAGNKGNPKEANVLRQAQQGQDSLRDMYAKVSQLKSPLIRQRTIDTLRNLIAQSVLQDQMVVASQMEAVTGERLTRLNVELHSGESVGIPAQIPSPARPSEFSEAAWVEPYTHSNGNITRLLPYAGVSGAPSSSSSSVIISSQQQNNEYSRRGGTNSGMRVFSEPPTSFLSSNPPRPPQSLPFTSPSRRSDGTVSNNAADPRGRLSSDPWVSSMGGGPYLGIESNGPSYVDNSGKKKRVGPSAREDGMNDLCRGPPDPFEPSSNNQRLTFLQMEEVNSTSPAQGAEKSVLEVGDYESLGASSLLESPRQLRSDSHGGKMRSEPAFSVSGPSDQDFANKEVVSEEPESNFRRSDRVSMSPTTTTTIPVTSKREGGVMDADLDSCLLNISGTAFLAEPASPESASPVAHSFATNVTYKGRTMNSSNNPWVSSSTKEKDDPEDPSDNNSEQVVSSEIVSQTVTAVDAVSEEVQEISKGSAAAAEPKERSQ